MADTHTSTLAGHEIASIVEDIAREAGDLALNYFRSLASLSVEKKGHLDLVTEADKQVEEFLTDNLRKAFPDDGIFGEEGGEIAGTSGRLPRPGSLWMIRLPLSTKRPRPTCLKPQPSLRILPFVPCAASPPARPCVLIASLFVQVFALIPPLFF